MWEMAVDSRIAYTTLDVSTVPIAGCSDVYLTVLNSYGESVV